jgi:mRNA-degrading endonuclease RelE of RelBE toxin-antitoxin system
MYKVIITPKAKRELKLIKNLYKRAIILAIDELQQDPLLGKPLKRELHNKYCYRVGFYRIIYTINEKDKKSLCPHSRL